MAGMPFTQGTAMFAERVAAVDDPLVAALRRAGAVIVGKVGPAHPLMQL